MIEIFRFQANEADTRKRLDEFLFERIGAVSKMYLRSLLLAGKCRVNNELGKAGYRLNLSDAIEIEADSSAVTSMKPEPILLEILFEDEEIIVVNKPPEMLVHPTRNVKSGTLLNALSYHLNKSLESGVLGRESSDSDSRLQTPDSRLFIRPGLIHRLDKKTSGLIIVAKTARAHRILSDHFQRRLVEKKYYALVEGVVKEDFGVIEARIGQAEDLKKWCVMENGKDAETRFRVVKREAGTTLLELQPITGRTNQLRIHCEFFGHPIVGDVSRGGREFPRLCLHAAKLSFHHPSNNEIMEFETDIPKDFTIN